MRLHLRNSWFIALYALVAIVLPWITVLLVYGFNDGWTLIGLYSHLFWFPVLFGVAQVVFLLRLLRVLDEQVKTLLWRVGLPFSVLVLLASVYIQGSERPALFELKRARIQQVIPNTDHVTFIEHLKRPVDRNKAVFEENLPKNSWIIPASDRSVAEVVVGLSILLQIFVWVWTALAFCWAARLVAPGNPKFRSQRKVFIPTMLWTLILSLPWFAMRKVFENYRGQAYTNLEIPRAAMILGFVFILGSVFLAAVTWRVIGERLNSAVGLVSTLGISGLFFTDSWLEAVFPRTPSVSQFLLIVIVVAFILTILLVKMPEPRSRNR